MNNLETILNYYDKLDAILGLIGYTEEPKQQFIQDFMKLVESKMLRKVYARLDTTSQEQFKHLLYSSTPHSQPDELFNEIVEIIKQKITKDELALLYFETMEDFLLNYVDTISKEATMEQVQSINGVLAQVG